LDKTAGAFVNKTIFRLPGKYGKGVLITPTVHGNLLVGPTAMDITEKDGIDTTQMGIKKKKKKSRETVKNPPLNQVITSFSGLRAHQEGHEFIIEEVADAPRFIDCAGIESPGLTSAPAVGKLVAELILEKEKPKKKETFIAKRKRVFHPWTLSKKEQEKLIQENPAYGNVICRCEKVTEGEIIDAVTRPLGATSLDGVKRRTRAGSGRCQGGFCMPRVMEIIGRECKIPQEAITKNSENSKILVEVEEP
jgi:glycerol-3-phosphate dehydrogenase